METTALDDLIKVRALFETFVANMPKRTERHRTLEMIAAGLESAIAKLQPEGWRVAVDQEGVILAVAAPAEGLKPLEYALASGRALRVPVVIREVKGPRPVPGEVFEP